MNPLDVGICDEEEAFQASKPDIIHKHGVNSETLLAICQELDTSLYGFDITGKNFIKNISKSQNYRCFVYYCVNNHCYCIVDKQNVKSLVERAKRMDTKFDSIFFQDEQFEESTDRFLGDIEQDIEVKDLVLYPNATIIYNKPNLNSEFEQILHIYAYVLKVSYKDLDCVRIQFNLDGLNIYMSADPNIKFKTFDPNKETGTYNWKDVQKHCEKLDIKFSNQSIVSVLKEERGESDSSL